MAKTPVLGLALLFLVLVISPTTVLSNSKKEITLYATITRAGPNPNTVLVAGPGAGPPTSDQVFGAVSVTDAPLRETSNANSPVVGSLQGLLVVASKNGDRLYFSTSVKIENGKYKTGTLQLQGTVGVDITGTVTGGFIGGELGVPSGTEAYRFNHGYAEVQTLAYYPATKTGIYKFKFVVPEIDD